MINYVRKLKEEGDLHRIETTDTSSLKRSLEAYPSAVADMIYSLYSFIRETDI